MIALQEQRDSPYFPFIIWQCEWPPLSRKVVEIQKFCYHGNITSHFSSLLRIRSGIAFTILEKWPRRPGTGVKEGFEEKEHEFPLVTFPTEKQEYLFRCPVALGNLPLKRPKKSSAINFLTWADFLETFLKIVNNHYQCFFRSYHISTRVVLYTRLDSTGDTWRFSTRLPYLSWFVQAIMWTPWL